MAIISVKSQRHAEIRYWALAVFVVVALALLLWFQLRGNGPSTAQAPSKTVLSAPSSPFPTASAAAEQAPQATRPPRTAPAPAPPTATLTKAQEFDRLARSSDAADYITAAKMAFTCRANSCGDLSPGQLAMAYDLVQRAVAAHVPTASTLLLTYAPDGREFEDVWNDPAYAAWKQNGLDEMAAAARRGDAEAMHVLAQMALNIEENREKALTYWIAYADKARQAPTITNALNIRSAEDQMARFKDGLTPEQIARATAAGHAIAQGEQK